MVITILIIIGIIITHPCTTMTVDRGIMRGDLLTGVLRFQAVTPPEKEVAAARTLRQISTG